MFTNVWPDLVPNCLTHWEYIFARKKLPENKLFMKIAQPAKAVALKIYVIYESTDEPKAKGVD